MTLAFKDTPAERKHASGNDLAHTVHPEAGVISGPAQSCGGASQETGEADEDDDDSNGAAKEPEDVQAPSAQQEDHGGAGIMSSTEIDMVQDAGSEQAGPHDDAMMIPGEEGGFTLLGEARRPSISSISASMSDASEFDVADDDDDYGAVDQLSQATENDADIEQLDSGHLAANVTDWIVPAPIVTSAEEEETAGVNWDDHRTYDFEYTFQYSDAFPVDSPMADALMMDLFNGRIDPPYRELAAVEAPATAPADFDPHIGTSLFSDDMSTSDDSSEASKRSKEKGKQKQANVLPPPAGDAVVDDTESEDLTEEIERRRRLSESKQKRKMSKKKRKSSHKRALSAPVSTHASKIQKFTRTPRKLHASPRMTSRGRIICMNVSGRTKISWITGRVPIDPSATAPSPELTRHLRSRMFQQAYCPDTATLDAIRQLSMTRGYTQAVFNQPLYTHGAFEIAPWSPHAANSLMSAEGGDFTNFIDDDGEPGITIAEQFLAPPVGWMDDDASNQGLWNGGLDELDEDNTSTQPGSSFADTETLGMTEVHDTDETPCPKRQRVLENTEDDDDSLETQCHLFSSATPQAGHVIV